MKHLILCLLSVGWVVSKTNPRSYLCSVPEKCYCVNLKERGVTLNCANITSEEIAGLSFDNVTFLSIRDFKLTDPSALRSIRRISAPLQITISDTDLDFFSWDWMPANISQLSLSRTGITDIYDEKINKRDGTIEYKCRMEHVKTVRRLLITNEDRLKNIPSCLPSGLRSMSFRLVNFSELGNVNRESVTRWPRSLVALQLSNTTMKTLPGSMFANANLTSLFIRKQPISDSSILLNLPARTLRHLILQETSLSFIPEEHFVTFREYNILTKLGISHSSLQTIPRGLPSSITRLYLNDNNIRHLDAGALQHLTKLQYLEMRRNSISTVPKGLPTSIEQLFLDHNEIVLCHDEAFSMMDNLTTLILDYNSLTSMPLGIPKSISHYSVKNNAINDIGPPSNYDFCVNCSTFNIESNPWACNTNMMRFLIWTVGNRNRTDIALDPSRVTCGNGVPGINNLLLDNLMAYIEGYKMWGCVYEATTLNCTANGKEQLPQMIKILQHVYIVDNPSIKTIPNFFFAPLESLTILELENIGLTRVPTGLPKSILKLSLARNHLTEISYEDSKALSDLTKLQTLDLTRNRLKTFPLACVHPLRNLKSIILQGNPLDCNCDLYPYSYWSRKLTMTNSEVGIYEAEGLRGTCATPPSLNGTDVTKLYDHFTNKELCLPRNCHWDTVEPTINCSLAMQKHMVTPDEITLHETPVIPSSTYWREIDLSGLQLKASAVNLTHLVELTTVKLSNNSLSTPPLRGLPDTVTNLTMDYNNISAMPTIGDIRSTMANLTALDLRFNNIRNLSDDDIRLFRQLRTIKIHGNPLSCDCSLKPLHALISASHADPTMKSHNLESLTCSTPPSLAGKTIVELTETELCPTINVAVVIGATIGGLALLISMAIFLIIYWNRKFKIQERKAILRGFRDLLQQEAGFTGGDPETGIGEDARFRYDAFLSYAKDDEDEEFATMLLDKLEITHGYKICVNERDFVTGVGIADNIVECIGASKRIILILSQNFVSSPWCQYEVQVALTELHQKRKSKLLIPILLEDLEDRVEGSVKTFLSLVKGIKIPSTKNKSSWVSFWSEILSAMPETPTVDETEM